jgi:hypothetical protein
MEVSSANMKLRFPEFATTPDAQIEFAIEEASRSIDTSWIEKDRLTAWMYLAAHYLMALKQAGVSGTGQEIASERFADFSVTYRQQGTEKSGDLDDFSSTLYGRRFLKLNKLSHPAIAVV